MSDEVDDGGRPPTFSERHGYVEYSTAVQHRSLNGRTRTDLWNLIELLFADWRSHEPIVEGELVWTEYLGMVRTAYVESRYRDALQTIVFDKDWHLVYSLVQGLMGLVREAQRPHLADLFNRELRRNRAGYRVIGTDVTPITNDQEVAEVAQALESASAPARTHLQNAISLFANRETPQYAKAISEAILAVEAAARELAGTPSATLTSALKSVARTAANAGRNEAVLHPALIDGWIMLYAFTSDDGGVRHALRKETATPSPELAQYFIVTCSAFVNFVAANKADRHAD